MDFVLSPYFHLTLYTGFLVLMALASGWRCSLLIKTGSLALSIWIIAGGIYPAVSRATWYYYIHFLLSLLAAYLVYEGGVLFAAKKRDFAFTDDTDIIMWIPVVLAPLAILLSMAGKLLTDWNLWRELLAPLNQLYAYVLLIGLVLLVTRLQAFLTRMFGLGLLLFWIVVVGTYFTRPSVGWPYVKEVAVVMLAGLLLLAVLTAVASWLKRDEALAEGPVVLLAMPGLALVFGIFVATKKVIDSLLLF